ncbi:hydroxyisourate hydrolase [Arthrobacter sp.]|uniref:hydroxyisourate hydrolase n=1 Tax=Arthrobacter sp. TaxID=1667 RepID=UPI002810D391|nr:hydroxyisourate hydrolase [Arthrobacter sp.]
MTVSQITTHVLDTALGRPATGVAVGLYTHYDDGWHLLATGTTDADGRIKDLGPAALPAGTYRLNFGTGSYYKGLDKETFFPEVDLVFAVNTTGEHYHVPLLLSPFGYSTYRGS